MGARHRLDEFIFVSKRIQLHQRKGKVWKSRKTARAPSPGPCSEDVSPPKTELCFLPVRECRGCWSSVWEGGIWLFSRTWSWMLFPRLGRHKPGRRPHSSPLHALTGGCVTAVCRRMDECFLVVRAGTWHSQPCFGSLVASGCCSLGWFGSRGGGSSESPLGKSLWGIQQGCAPDGQ